MRYKPNIQQAQARQHLAQDLGVLLKAVLIECVALQQVFAQGARGPLAELCALFGVDAVAHREKSVEVIVLDRSRDVSLNTPEFPECCFTLKLLIFVDILQVLVNRAHILVEQLCHLPLTEPQGLLRVIKPRLCL